MMRTLLSLVVLATLPLAAQQTLPLPPRDVVAPVPQTVVGIPSQTSTIPAVTTVPAPAPVVARAEASTKPVKPVVLSPEAEEKRLGALPFFTLQTNKAPLADVLMLLADTCQMSYVGLEKGVGENVQISVNISKNPYEILKLLCERYNVALDYEKGIWRFALYNDNELIARVYHLRYNNLEEVSSSGGGSSVGGGSSAGGSSAGGSSSSAGGSGGGFSVKKDGIVKDLEVFLGFTSKDPAILTAEDFDVTKMTEVMARGVQRVLPTMGEGTTAESSKGKVIYNSDNRSLYVLATRAQHQWIERYLTIVDKPQKQILIETKVYETGMNPSTALGINWNEGLNRSASTSFGPADGTQNLKAILKASDFTATLRMLDSDSSTNSIQYPRQVTIANRPVSLSSVEQVPVQDTQTSTSTDTTANAQVQTSVKYIPVGVVISMMPQIVDGNKIKLDVSISVSSIADEKTIGGNKYPVVAERNYQTQAIVDSGYTLAIGGLKSVSNTNTYSGVPVVSKVPVFGALFRGTTRSHKDTNLLLFISPSILDEYRGGVKSEPQFILPRDKDTPERRIFQGSPDESYTDILLALAGMDREIDLYSQRVKEQIDLPSLRRQLDERENELKLMQVRLAEIALEQPEKDVSQPSQQIRQYLNDLNELRSSITQRRNTLFR